MDGRSQTGLVACSAVDDYLKGVIKKHENTRKEKEEDRIRHVDVCSAQTGPIFLAYRASKTVKQLLNQVKERPAAADFQSEDGIGHRVWVIDGEEEISRLTEQFGVMEHTYIADGHHRAASAVAVSLKRREEKPGYTGQEEFNLSLIHIYIRRPGDHGLWPGGRYGSEMRPARENGHQRGGGRLFPHEHE